MSTCDTAALRLPCEEPQPFPLGRRYEELRRAALEQDKDILERRGRVLELVDPRDPLDHRKNQIVEERLRRRAGAIDEKVLRGLGFTLKSSRPPSASQLTERRAYRFASRLGAGLTRVSPAASLWIDQTKHSSFGLEPVYQADKLPTAPFFLPGADSKGRPHSLGDPRRARLRRVDLLCGDPAIDHWLHLNDPVEVRKRGRQACRNLVAALTEVEPRSSPLRICGIACGAARADIQAALQWTVRNPHASIELDLLDMDHGALQLAKRHLEHDHAFVIEGHRPARGGQLRSSDGRIRVHLLSCDITDRAWLRRIAFREGNQGYDLVEATGTIEYFSAEEDPTHPLYRGSAYSLLTSMKEITRPGGFIQFAHMTSYHNLVRILGSVGWRRLKPKSLLELNDMIHTVFPAGNVQLQLFRTGSYLFVSVAMNGQPLPCPMP